jgi:IS30 family transposase
MANRVNIEVQRCLVNGLLLPTAAREAAAHSHETIYRYIWHDKRLGGSLYLFLRSSRKKKWKRYGALP